jgi:hypothetical protein
MSDHKQTKSASELTSEAVASFKSTVHCYKISRHIPKDSELQRKIELLTGDWQQLNKEEFYSFHST